MEALLAVSAGQLGQLVVGAMQHVEADVALLDALEAFVDVLFPEEQAVQHAAVLARTDRQGSQNGRSRQDGQTGQSEPAQQLQPVWADALVLTAIISPPIDVPGPLRCRRAADDVHRQAVDRTPVRFTSHRAHSPTGSEEPSPVPTSGCGRSCDRVVPPSPHRQRRGPPRSPPVAAGGAVTG